MAGVIDVSIDGGRTLARRLRDSQPDLHVLLLAQDQPLDLDAGDVMLREPFELSDVVASVIDLVRASDR